MKRNPLYNNAIKDTGSDRFWLIYGTKLQRHIYKEYIRLHKDSAFICLNATGGVVKKLRRGQNTSGSIFLYSIVMNFRGVTCAAWQMLSKSHDTEFITLWLKQWIRDCGTIPPETVCDNARALLNAISVSCNNQTIKAYNNHCFLHLVRYSTTSKVSRPCKTFIRIDVAHLVKAVSLWKCFQNISHREIKDFYIRCITLMVDCTDFQQIERIFSLTCYVSIHKYNGDENDVTNARIKSAKRARIQLEQYLKVWETQKSRKR